MNFATWDLETSNLDADFGVILCSCLKPLGKKVETLRIDDYIKYKKDRTDYSGLIEELRDRFNKIDCVVTYYGYRFDMPFYRSGLLLYKMGLGKNLFHIDLWYTSKFRLRFHNNRLSTLIDYLGVSKKKTPLESMAWKRAIVGDKKSLDYIVQHCSRDVQALEEVYEQLKEFITRIERRP